MKQFWKVNPRQLAIMLGGWLVATNILALLTHNVGWWPFKILLFLCLVFLPGLALLRVMRTMPRTVTVGILYSFCLSILLLMISGLAANQLLFLVGVTRPLEVWGALGTWDAMVTGLIIAGFLTNKSILTLPRLKIKKIPKIGWMLIVASAFLPVLAVLGAFRLNNGGDALLAQWALGYGAALIIFVLAKRRQLPEGLLAWFIFIAGFTILLMTSLRGWDIVGHDIAREFRVFTLTHQHAHWDIALNRDPYNACLSITILPEMFARILNVSGLVVFKLILQAVFAACPVVIFILLRRYTPKLGALIGTLLFICYPTFINDSAMLTRQGVAYLFFALALLLIANSTLRVRYKMLFLLCALGAVLSHYSTAYMFVALFAAAAILKTLFHWWQRRKRSAFHYGEPKKQKTILSPLFATLLFLFTFIWYSQITATSDGLIITLRKSLSNLPQLFTDDNKSSDTSTVLLFGSAKTQADLYQAYLTDSLSKHPTTLAEAIEYMPLLTSDDLPLTPLGKQAHSVGIDPTLIITLRQNFAKVLQLLALLGVVYVTYRFIIKKDHSLGPDFIFLSLAGLVLLAFMVLLPVLSINYGILRAFQQGLIFLILPITVLLVAMSRWLKPSIYTNLAISGIVILFLTFTGWFAQLLGGVSPSLTMNNQGLYYGLYYSTEADAQAFRWIKSHIPANGSVRAANFNRAFMHDPMYPFSTAGILPSQINEFSFVYLDPAQTQAKKLYTYHDSSPLIMTFPLDYYDSTKNQIYSTAQTRIYR